MKCDTDNLKFTDNVSGSGGEKKGVYVIDRGKSSEMLTIV